MTTNPDEIFWLTSNDMINLQLISKCVGVFSVFDNSKNINQNQWNNCVISDMGYHSATNKHLFEETEHFILLRFLENSHRGLFYDRNSNCAIFSTKKTTKNRAFHQIMKFCDPRTKFILIRDGKILKTKNYYMVNQKNQNFFNLLHHFKHGVQHHYTKKKNTIKNGETIHSNTSSII